MISVSEIVLLVHVIYDRERERAREIVDYPVQRVDERRPMIESDELSDYFFRNSTQPLSVCRQHTRIFVNRCANVIGPNAAKNSKLIFNFTYSYFLLYRHLVKNYKYYWNILSGVEDGTVMCAH